jgi:glycosyltransferase involved in cell wall biosynthesis
VRCKIVGSSATPAYGDYLDWVQRQLDQPEDAVSWVGNVSESELVRAYDEATVYVSMSEDEGFCLPIFEAMMHRNLVVAYDLPAIRELLGDSGVIFSDKCYPRLAGRIRDLLGSPSAYREMLDAQTRRALDLAQVMNGGRFMQLLSETEAA